MASSSSLASLPPFSQISRSRLQALYSDIARQKQSNPTSYNANVDWWRRTLETLVSSGQADSSDRLVLKADRSLVDRLKYDGVGKPLGLGAVVAELRSTNSLIPVAQFLSATQSVYDPGSLPWRVASYVVGKPLWWALEQMSIVSSEDSSTDTERWKRVGGEYVVLSLVERAAERILEERRNNAGLSAADALFDLEGFRRQYAPDGSLSDTDIKVILKYLERDKRVLVADNGVIKFVDSDDKREINSVDRGILELKTGVGNLHAQVDSIHRKIDECNEKISTNLRQKRKPMALSYLRSRKQLEELLTKRLGSLEILQSTLLRVEAAAGDVEIMKSYESSTTTLRAILAHPSLQRDAIDETMDAMASATADAREVDDAIRMGGEMSAADAGIDDAELEAELKALAEEAEAEKSEDARRKLMEERMRAPEGVVTQKEADGEGEIGREEALRRFSALAKHPVAAGGVA